MSHNDLCHYSYKPSGHQIVWCSTYWSIGLPCAVCGSQDKSYFSSGSITLAERQQASSEKGPAQSKERKHGQMETGR